MAQTEHIDPTGMGLLLVAAVSLPAALDLLIGGEFDYWQNSDIAAIIGTMLLVTAYLAYKANSTFGMTVFGLVGTGVIIVGNGSMLMGIGDHGVGSLIVFGLIYAFAIFWSICAKTPKLLTALLVTTALIFIVTGVSLATEDPSDFDTIIGVIYLANFVLNAWLGAGLCCDKIPTF